LLLEVIIMKYHYLTVALLSCMCLVNASDDDTAIDKNEKSRVVLNSLSDKGLTVDKVIDQDKKVDVVLKISLKNYGKNKSLDDENSSFDDKNPLKYAHPAQDKFYELEKSNLATEGFYQ